MVKKGTPFSCSPPGMQVVDDRPWWWKRGADGTNFSHGGAGRLPPVTLENWFRAWIMAHHGPSCEYPRTRRTHYNFLRLKVVQQVAVMVAVTTPSTVPVGEHPKNEQSFLHSGMLW